MEYPAIVYSRDQADSVSADDITYRFTKQYQVILVSRNPDDDKMDKLLAQPMCRHERFYVADNLNHDVFTIYF